MSRILLITTTLLFYVQSFAQVSSWEFYDTKKIRWPFNQRFGYQDPIDSKGNRWESGMPGKLAMISGIDTVFITENYPLPDPGNFGSPSRIYIGYDDAVVYMYSVRQQGNFKSYLAIYEENHLNFYPVTIGQFFQEDLKITTGNIWISGNARFDRKEKKFYQEDLPVEENEFVTAGMFIAANNSSVVYEKKRMLYEFNDSIRKWRIIGNGPYNNSTSSHINTAITTNNADNIIYQLSEKGYNEYRIEGAEKLGKLKFLMHESKNDFLAQYENGIVVCNNQEVFTYFYTDFAGKADENTRIFIKRQDNGILVLTADNDYYSFTEDHKLVFHTTLIYNTATGLSLFYKDKGEDFYEYYLKSELHTRSVVEIKNGKDSLEITIPRQITSTGFNLFGIDKDYIWVSEYGNVNNDCARLQRHKNYIKGKVFFDRNKDGVQNSGEPGADNFELVIQPSGLIVYPSSNGDFIFTGENDQDYFAEFPSDTLLSYISVELPFTLDQYGKNKIGIYTRSTDTQIIPELVIGRARCSSEGQAYINLKNIGYFDAEKVKVTVSGNSLVNISDKDSTGFDQDNEIMLEALNLKSKTEVMLPFNTAWASGEHTGEFALIQVKAELYKDNDEVKIFSDTISAIIRCSFDPNDISVTPAGIQEENYTKKNSTLSYQVRFENTGNDTAYTVIVYDTLDANIDYRTLKVTGSSHPVQTEINNGVVIFRFENIMLPDAKTNKERAQGYVRFTVKPRTGLEDYTVIKNKAGIVFDQNTPVITNEVFNTMGDAPQVLKVVTEENPVALKVYPNPASGFISVTGKDVAGVDVLNLIGKLMKTSETNQLSVGDLPAGIYFVRVYNSNNIVTGLERFTIVR